MYIEKNPVQAGPAATVRAPRQLPRRAEVLTVVALAVMIMWSVRPLLEEWALLRTLNQIGLSFLRIFASAIPLRPLHLVPSVFQWALGGGHAVGVALGTAVLMAGRYLAARWAFGPLLDVRARWIVATLAAVLPAWPGAWLGRFGPAQTTAVLFLLALGCAIRLRTRWTPTMALGCVLSIVSLLCIYQAVALCLLAIPVYMLFWGGAAPWRRALPAALTIAAGFAVYGVYTIAITHFLGSGGYESDLARSSGRLLTFVGLRDHIRTAYGTAFGLDGTVLPLMLLVAMAATWAMSATGTPHPGHAGTTPARSAGLAAALVLTLPLLSLIYVSQAHIQDIDRVLFPVSVGLVLVVATLLVRARAGGQDGPHGQVATAVVVALLAASLTSAVAVHRYAQVQQEVLEQTLHALQQQPRPAVLIIDTTGTLGDVYTLVNPTLRDALAFWGRDVEATICTPAQIERFHPVARRYPIPTTPHCEAMPPSPLPTLILTAGWDGRHLVVKP